MTEQLCSCLPGSVVKKQGFRAEFNPGQHKRWMASPSTPVPLWGWAFGSNKSVGGKSMLDT